MTDKTCIIVYDLDDVEALARYCVPNGSAMGSVLPLTPNAWFAAMNKGYAVLSPTSAFGDPQQRSIVGRLSTIRAKADKALKILPAPEREILRSQFDRMIFSQLRIEETLLNFHTCTIRADGNWQSCGAADAIVTLQRELIARKYANRGNTGVRIHQTPLCGLHEFFTCVLAYATRFASRRGRVVSGAMKDVMGVMDVVRGQGGRIVVIDGADGSWRDYMSLAKQFMKLVRRNAPIVIRISGDTVLHMEDIHVQIADNTQEPTMQFAAACADQTFRRSLAGFGRVRKQANRLFKILNPTAYLSSEISHETELVVSECAGQHGVPRFVLGRNAQGPTEDANAFDVKRLYLTARFPADLVDFALFWTDFGMAAGRQYLDGSVRIGRVSEPVLPKTNSEYGIENARSPRRILIADSFASWWTRHWWAFQTSDEYIEGLQAIAEAVQKMDNVQLVIRAKEKPECPVAMLSDMFSDYANVIVESREQSFSKSLASSDLLISFFSTTIHQALQARLPVLLFGGTRRHQYMPARCTPPSIDDRAAVYGFDGTTDISALLISLLDAHVGRPLTAQECVGFTPDERAPTVFDIGAAFAVGEMPCIFDQQAEASRLSKEHCRRTAQ